MPNEAIFILIKTCLPWVVSRVKNHMEGENRKKRIELSREEIDKKLSVVGKYQHMEKKPNIVKKTRHISNIEHASLKMPFFRFEKGDTVDTVGNKMWSKAHKITLELPDDADPRQVKEVMRSIKKSFLNHPCSTCKTHVRENLRRVPLEASTKHEAVKSLYEFHNTINHMLGKEKFSREEFSKNYSYEL